MLATEAGFSTDADSTAEESLGPASYGGCNNLPASKASLRVDKFPSYHHQCLLHKGFVFIFVIPKPQGFLALLTASLGMAPVGFRPPRANEYFLSAPFRKVLRRFVPAQLTVEVVCSFELMCYRLQLHSPNVTLVLEPKLESLDCEKLCLFEQGEVQRMVMSFMSVIKDREDTASKVAKDMLEQIRVRINERRSVLFGILPSIR